MSNDRKNRVFLSYASEDLDTVRQVYDGLIKRDLDVWFDKENLKLARPWRQQIEKAIAYSRYFVVCISEAAIKKLSEDKPGFQDSEIHFAYNIATSQPVEVFGIIPVRLEDCGRGDFRLSGWQELDLFDDFEQGLDKLAVDMGGTSLSDATAKDDRSEDEKFNDRLFEKAKAEYYAGKIKESFYLVSWILGKSIDDARIWNSKGVLLEKLGKTVEAIEAYDKALQIDPDFVTSWYNKGIALNELGKFEETIEACDRALQIDPNDSGVWHNKGIALSKLDKFEEAIEPYSKALKFDPNNASVWYNKGVALRKLGKFEEAILAFKRASEINPDYHDALFSKFDSFGKKMGDSAALQKAFEELRPEPQFLFLGRGL